jgi:N-acetylglutamate synthase-like GNAT family acetyltransferase
VELQVRDARVTDVDRITALLAPDGALQDADRDTSAVADLLRQLVVGAAMLALRPSVRHGGLVGVVDLLAASPAPDADRIIRTLLSEVLRSARNKGCVLVEAEPATDAGDMERWIGWGFSQGHPRLALEVAASAIGH